MPFVSGQAAGRHGAGFIHAGHKAGLKAYDVSVVVTTKPKYWFLAFMMKWSVKVEP